MSQGQSQNTSCHQLQRQPTLPEKQLINIHFERENLGYKGPMAQRIQDSGSRINKLTIFKPLGIFFESSIGQEKRFLSIELVIILANKPYPGYRN